MDDSNFANGLVTGEAISRNNGYGNGWGGGWGNNGMFGMEWIFALLILPMLWGGNGGPFGRTGGGNPVTESDLCNSQNSQNLQNAVGRLNDQMQANQQQTTNGICQASYENLRNLMTLQMAVMQGDAATQRQVDDCCCTTQRGIDSVNFNAAMNAAAINANVSEKFQKVIDYLCAQDNQRLRDENLRNYINQQLCGVLRYPSGTTFSAGFNPFFNAGFCCNGNGNI